jgi:hypothetical protein
MFTNQAIVNTQCSQPRQGLGLRQDRGLIRAGRGAVTAPTFYRIRDESSIARDYTRVGPMIDQVVGTREVWLIAHPDLVRVARVRAVMDFLVEAIEEHRALLEGELAV